MKNWKTTIFAVLAVLPQILKLYPQFINPVFVDTISILFAALGIGYAKDHNVTGGNVSNIPNNASVLDETSKKDA
jgi:hypothetical protein